MAIVSKFGRISILSNVLQEIPFNEFVLANCGILNAQEVGRKGARFLSYVYVKCGVLLFGLR